MANEQSWGAQFNSNRAQTVTAKKKEEIKKGLMAKAGEKAVEPIQALTQKALRFSWLNLITSYGLTFLYIGFHAIMKYAGGIFSHFFCRLGEEGLFGLTPPPPKEVPGLIDATEWSEKIVVLSAFCIFGLMILVVFAQIVFLGWITTETIEVISEMGLSGIATFVRGLL
ncbi:MAG: hypothetical protein U9P90_01655 [Patescibacteria group bacterium]|nr:hypothetical protein [Patescibacteria group bacterium]